MAKLKEHTCKFGSGDMPDLLGPRVQHVIVWYHDKSTFYANNRWWTWWVHKSETPKPYTKGKGHSLMVDYYESYL